MKPDDKPRKTVGVYDRPPGADRRRVPRAAILIAVLVAAAWIAYFAFSAG
jgi:hypothetical protein